MDAYDRAVRLAELDRDLARIPTQRAGLEADLAPAAEVVSRLEVPLEEARAGLARAAAAHFARDRTGALEAQAAAYSAGAFFARPGLAGDQAAGTMVAELAARRADATAAGEHAAARQRLERLMVEQHAAARRLGHLQGWLRQLDGEAERLRAERALVADG